MRHNRKFNHLGRKAEHRKAMLANMACSLIMHKRITTTLPKAKELRKFIEPMVTRAKEDTTANRRIVFAALHGIIARGDVSRSEVHSAPEKTTSKSLADRNNAIKELFGPIAEKVGDRAGGYTRIIKLGIRKSDAASMCFIEFVDFDEAMAKEVKKTRRTRRSKKGAGEAAAAEAVEAPAAEVAEAPAAE